MVTILAYYNARRLHFKGGLTPHCSDEYRPQLGTVFVCVLGTSSNNYDPVSSLAAEMGVVAAQQHGLSTHNDVINCPFEC